MLPGPARNPHDLSRTPAASSAGSAAAVADFMTPLSIGTQTAGSILRPSAFCGAVGFKPTLDAIPYVAIRRYSRVLDVIGPIARSVDDAALFMRAFTGDPVRSGRALRNDFRVGVWRPRIGRRPTPACGRASRPTLRALSAAGVKVTELEMPAAFDTMGEAQDVIMAYDLAREYAAIKRDHAALCDPGLIDYLTMGEGLSAAEYAAALDAADGCRRAFYDAARDVDAVALPSTLGEAPPASTTGSSAFIRASGPFAQPSITLPVARP